MLHLFSTPICGVEPPERFTNPFDYEPHPLVDIARGELCQYLEGQRQWHDEIEQGKMFGVLVVENSDGELGFLAAFSGYLDKRTQHSYFVPPIVDLLEPGGFFAVEEANISQINSEIARRSACKDVIEAQRELSEIISEEQEELSRLREEYLTSRAQRRELREQGEQGESLNCQSQHQKGNIRRRELYYRELRKPLEGLLEAHRAEHKALVEQRQRRSAALQRLTFENFSPLNARGEQRNLTTIFNLYNGTIPPAGSGECAAPKLLHYAYQHNLRPRAMGEFWWGSSTRGQVRHHMHYYPACRGKCHPILSFMLQGLSVEPAREQTPEQQLEDRLSVIYEDDSFVVFNKPSGLASVRGLNHTISVQSIVEKRYPHLSPNNLIVHRLDMDTSGVLIIAKSAEVQHALQQQFAEHSIRKRYVALVDGIIQVKRGAIDLPLLTDHLDRPRQKVDFENGKSAYTFYSVMSVEGACTRLALYPQTGRTHQLRVHCAHHQGLATPIVGDRLYGTPAKRLMLHAEQITFRHPATNRKFTLSCEPEF